MRVLKQDDSCHWYLIPLNMEKQFVELSEKIETSDGMLCVNEFEDLFEQYRIDGPHRLIIKEWEIK